MSGSKPSTPSQSQPDLGEITRLSLIELEKRLKDNQGKALPATGLINVVLAGLKAKEKESEKPQVDVRETDVLEMIASMNVSADRKRGLLQAEINRTEDRLRTLTEAWEHLIGGNRE